MNPLRRLRRFSVLGFLLLVLILPVFSAPLAVHYAVKGILHIEKTGVCLHTDDGRVFHLIMDAQEAKSFDGQAVSVRGKVAKADEVENLKVKSIEAIPESQIVEPEVAREGYQRPARLLGTSGGKLTIDNVRWGISQDPSSSTPQAIHGWEKVTVDPAKVKKAYFAMKPFAPKFLAAHTLFVFSFEPGGCVSATGKESNSLGLTIEAFKKAGQTYGLVKTMKKVFDIVWILTTWDNYANLNVNFNKSSDTELIIYPMNLTPEQTRALLEETLKQACVNRQGEFYNTIRNNCTNNLIILLNHVLPAKQRIKLWKIPSLVYNYRATMPMSVAKMLIKKGFMGEALFTVNRSHFTGNIEGFGK
jgi:hypothetical protein